MALALQGSGVANIDVASVEIRVAMMVTTHCILPFDMGMGATTCIDSNGFVKSLADPMEYMDCC